MLKKTQMILWERDWQLASRRQRGDVGRDWRETSTPIAVKYIWQVIQNVIGYKSRSTSIICEVPLLDELNTFHLLNKDSAVKSALPPGHRPLSVTTVDVRKLAIWTYYSHFQHVTLPGDCSLLPRNSHHRPLTWKSAVSSLISTT